MSARLRAFARLGEGVFDLCVIGAGVVGSRVAYEAAKDGLRVALVDAGDFGGSTSSASSKFLHGGIRYFVQGHFGIARDGQREKRVLERDVVPGLARPMPMVVSVERKRWAGPLALRAALFAYDAVGGWVGPRSRIIDAAEARRLVPALEGRPLGSCFIFDQTQVDDARLVLATALAAADSGAVVMNHARVIGLAFSAVEARVQVSGPEGDLTLRAKSVINASGAWIDAIRRMEDPKAAPVARLSKGVHAVLPLPQPWQAAFSVHFDDEHNILAVPWQGGLLVGVTDTPYEEAPGALAVSDADVDLVLSFASRMLPPPFLRRDRIRALSAGLRVLPRGEGSTATARRDNVTDVGPFGMVSVAGGKLTTHRLEAMDALQLLPPRVRPRRREPSHDTLVARGPESSKAPVSPGALAHLAAIYGDRAEEVLAIAKSDPSAFDRIHADGPDVWAQVRYAISNEYAMTVDDIIDRRTGLKWRGLADEAIREKIARMLLPRMVPS
jgi:glycerol-3-phosphate dehydrogenase